MVTSANFDTAPSSSSSASSSDCNPNVGLTNSVDGIMYTGFITSRVDDFTFELDNEVRTRLYISNHICSDLGAGLRPGAQVCLRNVHLVYLYGELVGFGACMYSQVQLLRVAPGFSNVLVSRSMSRVHQHLVSEIASMQAFPMHTFKASAWLSQTMITLAEKFGPQLESRYLLGISDSRRAKSSILSAVVCGLFATKPHNDAPGSEEFDVDLSEVASSAASPTPSAAQRDMHSEFFLHRNGCAAHAPLGGADHSLLPRVL